MTVPDPDLVDLAADFIESELGRYDFAHNWSRVQDKPLRVKLWLRKGSLVPMANEQEAVDTVVAEVDRLVRLGGDYR